MTPEFFPQNFLADCSYIKQNQRIEKLCGKNDPVTLNFISLQQLRYGTKNGGADNIISKI